MLRMFQQKRFATWQAERCYEYMPSRTRLGAICGGVKKIRNRVVKP